MNKSMALFHSLLPLRIPTQPYSRRPKTTKLSPSQFPRIPFRTDRITLAVLACSAPKPSVPVTEQDILEIIAESDGVDVNSLPCVRTYENDLARLTLVGAVDFEQALTAAAADGGEVASEHIAAGMSAMVTETVFPGSPDDHSTISTRLFLPARKVKEKAHELKSYLTKDILSSAPSRNILAMTFRQVVLQQLWSFELVLFRPGMKRNMNDLENPREVPASFTLSSSDEWVISVLAEVVSVCALASAERDFHDNSLGLSSNNLFHLFHKPERIMSNDSSIILYKIPEAELVGNAKTLLEKFNLVKTSYKSIPTKLKINWWTSSVYSKLEKIGGPEFSSWVNEYVPAYKLLIDNEKLQNLKFGGWKESANKRLEVLVTHSQMVCLANILDMYYEDLFTLPDKQLSCGAAAKSTKMSTNKTSHSLPKVLSAVIISGFFVVTVSVLGQLYFPHLHVARKFPSGNHSPKSSQTDSIHLLSMESSKLEELCAVVVKKIQDAFCWPGEIRKESGIGAWSGELPEYLRRVVQADSSNIEILTTLTQPGKSDEEIKASAQNIASYQVVLSAEGEIVGFQPTSRVAVNHWAVNPLAKELYGGRKLTPGFIEPSLKTKRPSEVVVLELLMSEDPNSYFALARPVNIRS